MRNEEDEKGRQSIDLIVKPEKVRLFLSTRRAESWNYKEVRLSPRKVPKVLFLPQSHAGSRAFGIDTLVGSQPIVFFKLGQSFKFYVRIREHVSWLDER